MPGRSLRTSMTLLTTTALVATSVTGAAAAAPAAAKQSRSALVSGWLPGWDLDRGVAAVEGNADLMRDASPFWFTARASSGKVSVSSSVSAKARHATMTRLRATKVTLIPSVADGSSPRAMAAILKDPQDRARHVRQLTKLVVDDGYDGIELDYERFAFSDGTSTWASTRPAWVAFIRALGAALHAHGKKLAVAVPPMYSARRDGSGGYWVYDYAGIAPAVDSLRIMTYDYSVSRPGPISPLAFVTRTLAFATTAFPRARIRMGLPAYGRLWVARDSHGDRRIKGTCPASGVPGTRSFTTATALSYLTEQAGGKAPAVRFDATAGEAVATFQRTYKGKTSKGKKTSCKVAFEAWWMDSRGVALRVPLVRQFGLAGVAVWHLGGLDTASWTALRGRALPAPTSMATVVSPQPLVAGSAVTITSKVVGGVPAGTKVTLKRRALGAKKWRTKASARLGADGTVRFRVKSLRSTAHWRVSVPGTKGHAAAKDTVRVRVVPRVRAVPSTTRPQAGARVTVAVAVSPGRSGMKVRRQVLANGTWRTLATTRTNASGRAVFTITWPTAPTTLTYRVVTARKGALAAGGESAHFTIHSR